MKIRLDQLVWERGLAKSRSHAQSLIMAGLVYSNTCRLEKSGSKVRPDIHLEVRGNEHPWVSRGGLKLEHALTHFGLDVSNATCLDLGASTGGFTDVLLARDAKRVYAIDVGHGQLDWKLRQDERVTVLDRTNARYLNSEIVPEPISFVCCDTSFIGLKVVLPSSMDLVSEGGQLVALIKPQFEVGKDSVGSKGIVKDSNLHNLVCEKILDWLCNYSGWSVLGITASPITGVSGNKEFLIAATKSN